MFTRRLDARSILAKSKASIPLFFARNYNDSSLSMFDPSIIVQDQPHSQIKNVLIWVAGGPVSGKTTFMHNMAMLMKNKYGQNIDNMMIVGSKLVDALDTQKKSIHTIVNARDPIIIDNRCIDEKSVEHVINFAKKNSYRTVMIYPWITYDTFCKRLTQRKTETNRDYNLISYWQKHLLFYTQLDRYMSGQNPFDISIVYNNNYNYIKPMLYGQVMHNSHKIDQFFPDEIRKQIKDYKDIKIPTDDDKCDVQTKFIPKPEFMRAELEFVCNLLLKDLRVNPLGDELDYHFMNLAKKQF